MDSALLSSRDGYPLEPKSGLNGVKPPVEFEKRIRYSSPGHAGKEGPHLAMTGASRGFSRAAESVWGFSRGTKGSSGSLSCGNSEVRSPWAGQGGAHHCSRVRVGESGLVLRGSKELRCPFESRWVSLGANLCPKGSQASCGVWIEDSGFLSRPCRKRRPSSRDDGGVSWVF